MSYNDNALLSSVDSNVFIKAKPSIHVTSANGFSWSIYSGNVWVGSWSGGYVVNVYNGTDEQTLEVDAASVGVNEYYYDHDAKQIYLYSTVNPNTANTFVITYEVYWSTLEAAHGRVPSSSLTPVIWENRIVKAPVINEGQPDSTFGFLPINGGSVELEMASGELNDLFVKSSFSRAQVEVWHLLGDLSVVNFYNIFLGVIDRVEVNENTVSLSLLNNQYFLDQTYLGAKYFSKSTFANLDPSAEEGKWPIRKVYGRVIGFIPVNIDFSDTPSTTNNRDWVVSQGQSNKASYDINQDHTGTNTATQTAINDTDNYIDVGDYVQIEGPTATVKVITKTATQITHASVGARSVTAGMTVYRPYIANIVVIDEEEKAWTLKYSDHWTEANFASDTKGFVLNDNFEATLAGFPSPFEPSKHKIYVNVYGETLLPAYRLIAGDVGSLPSLGGMVSNPVSIIADLVFQLEQFNPTQVAEGSFVQALLDLATTFGDPVRIGFAIPPKHTDEFQTYNEIITEICKSSFLRVHNYVYNGISGFAVSHFKSVQASSADYEMDSTEINEVNIEIDNSDIYTDFEVQFNSHREIHEPVDNGQQAFYINYSADLYIQSLFKLSRILKQDSLFIDFSQATFYASTLSDILSRQRVRYKFTTPYKLWDAEIGDVVSITRGQILGVDYVEGAVNTIKGSIVELSKSISGITATIEVY